MKKHARSSVRDESQCKKPLKAVRSMHLTEIRIPDRICQNKRESLIDVITFKMSEGPKEEEHKKKDKKGDKKHDEKKIKVRILEK